MCFVLYEGCSEKTEPCSLYVKTQKRDFSLFVLEIPMKAFCGIRVTI